VLQKRYTCSREKEQKLDTFTNIEHEQIDEKRVNTRRIRQITLVKVAASPFED